MRVHMFACYSIYMTPPSFFETFIKNLSEKQRQALRKLRTDILDAAPTAEEGASSGVPAFRYKGKYLASLNAAKNHLSFFMMRGNALKNLREDLQGFDATNVVVKFIPEKLIPADLVQKIIEARIQEIEESQPRE